MHKLIVLHALAIGCAGLAGGCGLQATTGWQGRATPVDLDFLQVEKI